MCTQATLDEDGEGGDATNFFSANVSQKNSVTPSKGLQFLILVSFHAKPSSTPQLNLIGYVCWSLYWWHVQYVVKCWSVECKGSGDETTYETRHR